MYESKAYAKVELGHFRRNRGSRPYRQNDKCVS